MVITVTLNPAVDKVLEVPGFHVGAHARAELKALLPAAGKGVNVARGLARLGGSPGACGLVGRDQHSLFTRSLEAEGVRVRYCAVEGQTRTNTTVLDPLAHTTTHLRERGFTVVPADVNALRTLLTDWLEALSAPATVVFAGSLPDGLEADEFAGLLRACAERDSRIVVDASGPALLAAVETGVVDTVKPNLAELGECLGKAVARDRAPAEAARLLDRVGTVLLTLAAEGAFLIRRGLTVGRRCPLDESHVRNTVGCGDAFLAGWLRGEQVCQGPACPEPFDVAQGREAQGREPVERRSLPRARSRGRGAEALCWAVAAGAACAMSETTFGYSLADVQTLLPRCEPVQAV